MLQQQVLRRGGGAAPSFRRRSGGGAAAAPSRRSVSARVLGLPIPGIGKGKGQGLATASVPAGSSLQADARALFKSFAKAASGRGELGWRTGLGERYELAESIGVGAFGQVFAGVDKKSNQPVAVKVLLKHRFGVPKKNTLKHIVEEHTYIESMRDCRGVVDLLDVFEDDENAYMVEERCFGGDLESIVAAHGTLDPHTLAMVAREVMAILCCCHTHGIVYADVRPSNFCVKDAVPAAVGGRGGATAAAAAAASIPDEVVSGKVRAVDFGAARRMEEDGRLYGRAGTPAYMAPEVFNDEFGPKADVWSAGVMLYQLYTGRLPFWESGKVPALASLDAIGEVVSAADADLASGAWASAPDDMRDFVRRCLSRREADRASPRELMAHAWLAALPEQPPALRVCG